jgi:hypothetical protein
LIPEDLILLNLALEELGYPAGFNAFHYQNKKKEESHRGLGRAQRQGPGRRAADLLPRVAREARSSRTGSSSSPTWASMAAAGVRDLPAASGAEEILGKMSGAPNPVGCPSDRQLMLQIILKTKVPDVKIKYF